MRTGVRSHLNSPGHRPGFDRSGLVGARRFAGGQVFCAVDSDEADLAHCVERLGEPVWLFSTDYPHSRNPWPNGVPMITDRQEVAESAKVRLLGENAQRLLPRLTEPPR